MYPLASQSSPVSTTLVEAVSVAPMVASVAPAPRGAPANDNQAAWKPNLLVQRRRRLSRRAVRS